MFKFKRQKETEEGNKEKNTKKKAFAFESKKAKSKREFEIDSEDEVLVYIGDTRANEMIRENYSLSVMDELEDIVTFIMLGDSVTFRVFIADKYENIHEKVDRIKGIVDIGGIVSVYTNSKVNLGRKVLKVPFVSLDDTVNDIVRRKGGKIHDMGRSSLDRESLLGTKLFDSE